MFTLHDIIKVDSLVEHLKEKRNVSILVGAGISVSSHVPTSAGIVRVLKRLHLIERTTDYATAMEEAFDSSQKRRVFLERLFIGKPPSQGHYALAHLVKNRVFNTIFTTNFDHLTEIALSQTCDYPVRSYLTREGLESIRDRKSVARVIKLHGDFLFSSLANTDEEMGRAVTDSMRTKFSNLLENQGLIVLGYAGDGSILRMLSELAVRPEILKYGVWWILHCGADGKPSPGPRLEEFLRVMQSAGKPTSLIRNSFGAQWLLNELCQRTIGEIPVKPKFGIGDAPSLSPQIGRDNTPPPSPSEAPVPEGSFDMLERQLQVPSLVFLRNATDGAKTALVARLIAQTSERPCFYFSFTFARNKPEEHSFLNALGDFLDAKGFLSENSRKRFWIEVLFERDGLIILDDLPISLDKTRRTIQAGPLRGSFPRVFYPALGTLAKLSKGNLIVCIPDGLPTTFDGDFLNISAIAPELKVAEIFLTEGAQANASFQAIVRGLSRTEKQVLFAMSELRFAEPADFIARLANTSASVVDALDRLVERGLVKGHDGKFIVRMSRRIVLLRHLYNTSPTGKIVKRLLHTAKEYESSSDDPECPSPRHCLLEAENAYYEASIGFQADKWTAGMKALVQVSLTLAQSSLSKDFIFETLKSYFKAAGDRIFVGLDLADVATLFSAFAFASPTDSKFNDLARSFLSSLEKRNELIPAWLKAVDMLKRNSYLSPEGSAMLMAIKDQIRRNKRARSLHKEEWELFGRCYLGLNRTFGMLHGGIRKPELLKRAIRYGQLAQFCFAKVQDEIGKDDSARFLGVTYINGGNYRSARRMLKPLFRKEMAAAGFGAFKAASLNNLYETYLGVGAFRLAEGYFWEANYQYAHSNRAQFTGPLLAIASLHSKHPASKVLTNHPEFQESLPAPRIVLRKLVSVWDQLDSADKGEQFFRVSQVTLIMSQWFDEHNQLAESMKALAFVVKVHEECFGHAGQEGAPTQLQQVIVLNQLKARILDYASSAGLRIDKITQSLGPLRTKVIKEMIDSIVP